MALKQETLQAVIGALQEAPSRVSARVHELTEEVRSVVIAYVKGSPVGREFKCSSLSAFFQSHTNPETKSPFLPIVRKDDSKEFDKTTNWDRYAYMPALSEVFKELSRAGFVEDKTDKGRGFTWTRVGK